MKKSLINLYFLSALLLIFVASCSFFKTVSYEEYMAMGKKKPLIDESKDKIISFYPTLFIDGNKNTGINYNSGSSAYFPQLTVFNNNLYAIWSEYNGISNQIRVALYDSSNKINPWIFVDGNLSIRINYNTNNFVLNPQLTAFNNDLYAIWSEINENNIYQIRVAKFNKNKEAPEWLFVDLNTDNGINYNYNYNAEKPQLTVFDNNLYAIWSENNGISKQIRVALYDKNNAIKPWSFADGNLSVGINYDSAKSAIDPQLTSFNGNLYAIWAEYSDRIGQIRIAVFDKNNPIKPWSFTDCNTTNGINYDNNYSASSPQLTVCNNKIYATWIENNINEYSPTIRIALFNDNLSKRSFVDGNEQFGLRKKLYHFTYHPQLTEFDNNLYLIWSEPYTDVQDQIHIMTNDKINPSMWHFIDGNTDFGINKNSNSFATYPQLTVFNNKLYAIWCEQNETATNPAQIRAAVSIEQ